MEKNPEAMALQENMVIMMEKTTRTHKWLRKDPIRENSLPTPSVKGIDSCPTKKHH